MGRQAVRGEPVGQRSGAGGDVLRVGDDSCSLRPRHPEIVGGARVVPAQAMRYCTRAVGVGETGLASRQLFEKTAREEMAMRVADSHPGKPIIIGLVADTHGRPHPDSGARIAAERADYIVHAGDIGELAVLDELSKIAPVSSTKLCGASTFS